MKIDIITQEQQRVPWTDRRKVEMNVLSEYFKGIVVGKVMCLICKDEDKIRPGDVLVLQEWDGNVRTGHKTKREVTAVLRNCPECGLMDGCCILSLQTPGWDWFHTSVTQSGDNCLSVVNAGQMNINL